MWKVVHWTRKKDFLSGRLSCPVTSVTHQQRNEGVAQFIYCICNLTRLEMTSNVSLCVIATDDIKHIIMRNSNR